MSISIDNFTTFMIKNDTFTEPEENFLCSFQNVLSFISIFPDVLIFVKLVMLKAIRWRKSATCSSTITTIILNHFPIYYVFHLDREITITARKVLMNCGTRSCISEADDNSLRTSYATFGTFVILTSIFEMRKCLQVRQKHAIRWQICSDFILVYERSVMSLFYGRLWRTHISAW